MRCGIDDTKYIVLVIKALLEKEEKGQLSPATIKELKSTCKYLEKVIEANP